MTDDSGTVKVTIPFETPVEPEDLRDEFCRLADRMDRIIESTEDDP